MEVLITEIQTDPLVRGYSGMTDQQLMDSLNAEDRPTTRTSMGASEVMNAIDATEWDAKSLAEQTEIWNLLALGELNPQNGTHEVKIFTDVFGGGSATITNLNAARTLNVSRGVEIGFGTVSIKHVQRARLV
jgi:hypothetical protein